MKNIKIYVVGVICLAIGFAAAWISDNQTITDIIASKTSQNQTANQEIWTCSMHPQVRQNEPGFVRYARWTLFLWKLILPMIHWYYR